MIGRRSGGPEVAVVTGGTHGLGLAAARALVDGGAHVVLACREDDDGLDGALTVLAGRAGGASWTALGPDGGLEPALTGALAERGRVDAVVHHAVDRDLSPVLVAAGALAKVVEEGGKVVLTGHVSIPFDRVLGRLALELAPFRIAVNVVTTALLDPGHRNLDPALPARLAALSPSGRLTSPGDVARVVALFCSDDAACVQAQTVHVDGGLSLAHGGVRRR